MRREQSPCSWDAEKLQILREAWEADNSFEEIGALLGFKKYHNGGKHAVMGKVNRLRKEAKKAGNDAEVAFWTRPPKDRTVARSRGMSVGTNGRATARTRTNKNAPPPLNAAARRKLIDSVDDIEITWPTDDEVSEKWRSQLLAEAANADRRRQA